MRVAVVCVGFLSGILAFSALAQPESRLPRGIPGLMEGQSTAPPTPDWLLGAQSDEERFRRIQIYAGGTYEQMWQIGYRYEQVYAAIADENWALANHHWKKIRSVFNVALMKRPRRTPNAEALFLDTRWGEFSEALATEEPAVIRASFQVQRDACMACHVAEDMSFLNDSPIFRDTAFRDTAVFPAN